MLELPECRVIARQLSETIAGKTIQSVVVDASPHGFAFYFGDPSTYNSALSGKTVGKAIPNCGQVELFIEDMRLCFNDGVNIRYFAPGEILPKKHQLLVAFTDGSALVCTVQMYGGMMAFPAGKSDNFYYKISKERPSPFLDAFNEAYFAELMSGVSQSMSLKAFLATEQRIPGLGNGVLQDILFHARLHPKAKLSSVSGSQRSELFKSVRKTLSDMAEHGGRDTEKDIFGTPGGYATALSSKTYMLPCSVCGGSILRQPYMGGNVYFCPVCQPL